MNKLLLISPKKCKDCGTCESVCENSAVSVINVENEDAVISVPVTCVQCEDAACLDICPTEAIYRDSEDSVLVDHNKCVGCKLCVAACPFGNIEFSYSQKKILKCDLCGGSPDCAKYCPTSAIEFVDSTESNFEKKRLVAAKYRAIFD
jgi:Fe-S-cluster-containing hydrogenase component 2